MVSVMFHVKHSCSEKLNLALRWNVLRQNAEWHVMLRKMTDNYSKTRLIHKENQIRNCL